MDYKYRVCMIVDMATRLLGFLQCLFDSCLGFGITAGDPGSLPGTAP